MRAMELGGAGAMPGARSPIQASVPAVETGESFGVTLRQQIGGGASAPAGGQKTVSDPEVAGHGDRAAVGGRMESASSEMQAARLAEVEGKNATDAAARAGRKTPAQGEGSVVRQEAAPARATEARLVAPGEPVGSVKIKHASKELQPASASASVNGQDEAGWSSVPAAGNGAEPGGMARRWEQAAGHGPAEGVPAAAVAGTRKRGVAAAAGPSGKAASTAREHATEETATGNETSNETNNDMKQAGAVEVAAGHSHGNGNTPSVGLGSLGGPGGSGVALPAALHEGMIAAAGGTAQPLGWGHSATAGSATPGMRPETGSIAAGVSGGAPQIPTASPARLEVGVFSGTHGWLQIRAEMGAGGAVNASLMAGAAAHEALKAGLPEMATYLKSEAVSVSRIALHRMADGSNGSMASRQHGDGQGRGPAGEQWPGGGGLPKRSLPAAEYGGGPAYAGAVYGDAAWTLGSEWMGGSFGGVGGVGLPPGASAGLNGGWLNVCA